MRASELGNERAATTRFTERVEGSEPRKSSQDPTGHTNILETNSSESGPRSRVIEGCGGPALERAPARVTTQRSRSSSAGGFGPGFKEHFDPTRRIA